MRTHEEAINQLSNRLANYQVELNKWKEVTFNHKKDGTPFQNLNKCFNDADYGFDRYDERHERPYLRIWYWNPGYQESFIRCVNKDGTFMTFDEIRTAIKDRISTLETDIANCEKELKTVESWLNEIDAALLKVTAIIKKGQECRRYLKDYAEGKISSLYWY